MEYTGTYHGLYSWYKLKFEKLGWMLLAKHEGHTAKIKEYKEGINHLKNAIEEKIAHTRDLDKKDDLKILHKNVMVLLKHVEKDFKSPGTAASASKRGMTAGANANNANNRNNRNDNKNNNNNDNNNNINDNLDINRENNNYNYKK